MAPLSDYSQQLNIYAEQLRKQKHAVESARSEDVSRQEIWKSRTIATWGGIRILAVVTLVVLMFLYSQVFAKDKRIFWIITTILVCMLIYKFVEMVREDGGLAFGYMSG